MNQPSDAYNQVAQQYMEHEVLTAPPEKLHLMLIQGAMRFIRQAQRAWEQNQDELACESIIRAQEILGEMLAGLRPEQNRPLVSKVAAVYMFVFRSLIQAQLSRDQEALQDALRVLSIEEETWRQVCQQLAPTRTGTDQLQTTQDASSPGTSPAPSPLPPSPEPASQPPVPEGGLSLEA